MRGIILTQRGKGWHHPPGRPRVRVCTGFFTFRTRHCLSPGKMALTRARAPAGPFPHTPGPPHRYGGEKISAFRRNPGLDAATTPDRVISGPPVFLRGIRRTCRPARRPPRPRPAAPPPDRAGPVPRYSRPESPGCLPLLVGYEYPGGRPRGDGHGPLASSGEEKPEQFGRGLLTHTGSRGIVRHGNRKNKRIFPGVNPPATHEESALPSPESGRTRFPPAAGRLPRRGHAGPKVRYRRMVLENVALTATHPGGLNARRDANNVPGCESFPGIHGIQPQIQPAPRGGRFPMPFRLPRSDPALGDDPRPDNRNCNQNTGRDHSRKATGSADIAFAPELQPAPISPRS